MAADGPVEGDVSVLNAEVVALRAEVHELEKPHACAYSGMTVAACRTTVCDCFGGSTWPQRAMTAEGEVMRLQEALRGLVEGKQPYDFVSVARLKEAMGRG